MIATVELSHPDIGKVHGKHTDSGGVAQFHLQYATIEDRFAPAELVKYDLNGVVDATRLRPQALQHAPGPGFEQQHLLQHTLDYDRSTQIAHDLDCLNLNVTVPLSATWNQPPGVKLPVLCFIHGGGFHSGSGSFPQYDMTKLVQLSIEMQSPILAVSINYRLNAFGFLTSHELRAAGYETNNAFRDQRAALKWIKTYIAGFGGEPDNVTLMGESAGAISANYHLLSLEPLFRRVMFMSGSVLLIPPISLDAAEAHYQRAMQLLGLETATAEDRIRTLLTTDGIALCGLLLKGGIPFLPVYENDIVDCLSTPTFENITAAYLDVPGRSWCKAAIIGDCQFDGNVQFLRLAHRQKDIANQICSSFSKSTCPDAANTILEAYGIEPDTSDPDAFHRILEICTDVQFYAPTLSLAANLSQVMPVYMYRFNEPNPWPGQFQGQAIHIQDLTWLLQNYNEFLVNDAQVEQARNFAKDVISFVNGRHPWKPWRSGDKVARVIGPEGRYEVLKDETPGNGRRATIRVLAEKFGMDVLNEALTKFMNGE